jgi:hypothetical protein
MNKMAQEILGNGIKYRMANYVFLQSTNFLLPTNKPKEEI